MLCAAINSAEYFDAIWLSIFVLTKIHCMAIAYHGSAALFSRFDPTHLLEGDGKLDYTLPEDASSFQDLTCL